MPGAEVPADTNRIASATVSPSTPPSHLHSMILPCRHRKRSEMKPRATWLLLIHHNIGRSARMMNPIGHGLRSIRILCPFGIDVHRFGTGQGGGIGHPITAGATGHHHYKRHCRPLDWLTPLGGSTPAASRKYPGASIFPVLGLCHRHAGGAIGQPPKFHPMIFRCTI